MDKFGTAQRSALMSKVKSRDTAPEIAVRKAAHALGYRFRLHRKDLPGRPDIVFPMRKAAIFVNGCFWHQHEGCRKASMPATRIEFWRTKLARNKLRDAEAIARLNLLGWRVLVIWECQTGDANSLDEGLRAFLGQTVTGQASKRRFRSVPAHHLRP